MKTTTKTLALIACAAALGGCSAMRAIAPPAGSGFTLWSPAFADGADLPQRYSGNIASNPNCVGTNVSPALAWTNVPPGTRSIALLVHDQEGRNGTGVVHWIAYGISPSVSGFAENEVSAPSSKYVGGKSTQGLANYMGPCPGPNTGHHHYLYTAIATDLEPTALPPGLTWPEVQERLAGGHAKGASSIVLRFGRP